MYIIKLIAHTLSYSNSCVNPFIYAFMGTKFRSYFYAEFQNMFKCYAKDGRHDAYKNSLVNIHYHNTVRKKRNDNENKKRSANNELVIANTTNKNIKFKTYDY